MNKSKKSKMIALRIDDELGLNLKKMSRNFHLSDSEVVRRSITLVLRHLHQPEVHNHFIAR